MTTLSPAKARSNLTGWLKKAASGEEIGIRYGGKLFVIHPVEEEDTSYAEKEYGVTKAELERFTKRLHAEGVKNRRMGKTREYKGDIEAMLED
jgi:antitoxin (DNA-binding transcriptional repressor) of toxin-antitoxin stability system